MSMEAVTSDLTASADVAGDSCRHQFTKSYAGDDEGSSAPGAENGDWSAEVKQEILPTAKEKPEHVCYIAEHFCMRCPVFTVSAVK